LGRRRICNVQVADVEAADPLLGDLVVADVAVVAADSLVAAGAEGLAAGAVDKIIARPRLSSRARLNASRSSAIVWGRKRVADLRPLIVIRAIPSARS